MGCVTAACLAKDQSNLVYGIDPSEAKVDKINHGLPTVYEPYLDQLYEQLAQTNPIKAFSDLTSINEALDAIYVCVGTPLDKSNSSLDMSHVFTVFLQIKEFILRTNSNPAILLRSTLNPGTCSQLLALLEDVDDLCNGKNFQLYITQNSYVRFCSR